MGDFDVSDEEFKKMEAMILSMTPNERLEREELSIPRRKRVARGSGVQLDDVNRMVKGFKRIKQLFKNMPDMKSKMKGFDFSSLENLLQGNNRWH